MQIRGEGSVHIHCSSIALLWLTWSPFLALLSALLLGELSYCLLPRALSSRSVLPFTLVFGPKTS